MSSGAPSTMLSGGSGGPGDHAKSEGNKAVGQVGTVVLCAVVAPVAVMVWLGWSVAFRLFRTKWWYPAVMFGVVLVGVVVSGGDVAGLVGGYVQPWVELFKADNPVEWFLGNWWWWLWKQLWLGVLVGCAYSTVVLGWRWWRRPKWRERTIRPGPFLWWRLRGTRRKISMDEDTPRAGITLGVSVDVRDDRFAGGSPGVPYGGRVIIEDKELAGHFLVTGGTGSGKSLDVSTPLLLADGGFVTMGSVRVGDRVVGSDGQAVEVVYRSPVFSGRRCYRVGFDDGSVIVADGEHLWNVAVSPHGDGGWCTVTTLFLHRAVAGGEEWWVPGVGEGVVSARRARRVVSVRETESVPVRCIGVDADDSLFLAGVGCVPTHNTTSMLMGMRDVIKRGRGLIVVDCKGGPDIPLQVEQWCRRYGRTFKHWSMVDPGTGYEGPAEAPAFYDPISRGDSSRKKDLLLAARKKWDVEYYKSVTGTYMQTLFEVQRIVPDPDTPDTLVDVCKLMNPQALLERAGVIPKGSNPELIESLQRIPAMSDMERRAISSMYGHLSTILQSTAGKWLRCDPNPVEELRQDINLREVADEGQVVVFSLDSSNYEETAEMIAGLIIQDLKTLSSELRRSPSQHPVHVYVDEFSAVDATNILGLLNKARDAKIFTTVSTQALADLARKDPAFLDQVVGIVAGFIIHRTNSEEDARVFAGLSGVEKKTSESIRIGQTSSFVGSLGMAANKGSGTLSEVEDYAVPVGVFQKLEQGQCVFLANSPKRRAVNPVQVIRESPVVAQRQGEVEIEIFDDGDGEEFDTGNSRWADAGVGDDYSVTGKRRTGSGSGAAGGGGWVSGEDDVSANVGGSLPVEDYPAGSEQVVGEYPVEDSSEDSSEDLGYRVNRAGKVVPEIKEGFQDYTRKGGARKRTKNSKTRTKSATANGGRKTPQRSAGKYSHKDPYTYPVEDKDASVRGEERLGADTLFPHVVSGEGPGFEPNGVPSVGDYPQSVPPVTIPEDFRFPFPPASEPQKRDKSEVDSSEENGGGFWENR